MLTTDGFGSIKLSTDQVLNVMSALAACGTRLPSNKRSRMSAPLHVEGVTQAPPSELPGTLRERSQKNPASGQSVESRQSGPGVTQVRNQQRLAAEQQAPPHGSPSAQPASAPPSTQGSPAEQLASSPPSADEGTVPVPHRHPPKSKAEHTAPKAIRPGFESMGDSRELSLLNQSSGQVSSALSPADQLSSRRFAHRART